MPLAHTAYKPVPEVELLGCQPITIEDAVRGLEEAVAGDEGEAHHNVPGSALVNFRQVPRILESLKKDWLNLPVGERPACFVRVHGRLETHMHPCFLGEKLVAGLRGASGMLLLKFSSVLDCVPLGFTSMEPAGSHAAVVGESPYVHFLADFWAVGFVPRESQWLVGRISEIQTARGMNLQVLNSFNFFAPRWCVPPQLWFDHAAGRWTDDTVPADSALAQEWGAAWVQIKGRITESSGSYPVNFRGSVHGPRRPGEFPGDSQDPALEPPADGAKKKRKAEGGGGAEMTAEEKAAEEKSAKRAKKKAAAEAAEAAAKAAAKTPKKEKVKKERAGPGTPEAAAETPRSQAPNPFEEASAAAEAEEVAATRKAARDRKDKVRDERKAAEAAAEKAAVKVEAQVKKEKVKAEQAEEPSAVEVTVKRRDKEKKVKTAKKEEAEY
mmetsp:Transcript_57208/g.150553  ORF Transcript_57208/g.150553 Transcript_57208/m.150553 type:complete len:440 (+) Transcript_57208:122-1441(+)